MSRRCTQQRGKETHSALGLHHDAARFQLLALELCRKSNILRAQRRIFSQKSADLSVQFFDANGQGRVDSEYRHRYQYEGQWGLGKDELGDMLVCK